MLLDAVVAVSGRFFDFLKFIGDDVHRQEAERRCLSADKPRLWRTPTGDLPTACFATRPVNNGRCNRAGQPQGRPL